MDIRQEIISYGMKLMKVSVMNICQSCQKKTFGTIIRKPHNTANQKSFSFSIFLCRVRISDRNSAAAKKRMEYLLHQPSATEVASKNRYERSFVFI